MSLLTKKLGIDLGTANVLVYLPNKGVVINEPSVVAISEDKKKILAIGAEAKTMIGKTPDEIIAYKPMKDGVIADYRVTEAMLAYFIKKAVGKFALFKPEVMISVPAGINSTERRAVIEAAMKAGAKKAYIVKEPILGAIGSGMKIEEATGRMIVDIGGGTTDVAVISLGGIVCANSVKSAGNKIDKAIVDYVKKTYNLAIGEKTAEKIKIEVGSAVPFEPNEELKIKVSGRDYTTELPKTIEVSTNDVVKAISKNLGEMIKAIKDVLAQTPPELASDVIESGITLTGGTSQLRRLPQLVEEQTKVKAFIADDPLTCVARGTGIALNHLDVYKKAMISKTF
ncbi:rod shape-determining protein [Candidatus Campbellbacteria bacterium]|nr:MAG: rod shape-determining protein [Candidatus Campbellbacteria bacterium]